MRSPSSSSGLRLVNWMARRLLTKGTEEEGDEKEEEDRRGEADQRYDSGR